MLTELLKKHADTMPIVLDVKNTSKISIDALLFKKDWKADVLSLSSVADNISYDDICLQMANICHVFNLVTFELISGDVTRFLKETVGHVFAKDEKKLMSVTIPVIPQPALIINEEIRFSRLRYSDIEFHFDADTTYKLTIPGDCEIRISFYPVYSSEKLEGHSFMQVDPDTTEIVRVIAGAFGITHSVALTWYSEIGLTNILAYPKVSDKVKVIILDKPEWKRVVEKIQAVWSKL